MKAILKKEFLEIIRTKKLLILAIVLLFVAVSSPILAKLIPTIFKNLDMQGVKLTIPEATWKDSIDQFVKNLSQIALIVIVFMFAGSIAEEKNKKTLEIVLTKPITRSSFIISKFVSSLTVTSLVYLAGSIIFYIYTMTIFGSFSFGNFIIMALLLLLYLWQVISLTLFCSTVFSNQILAAGIAFFVEIIIVSILGSIDRISKYIPGFILGKYPDIMNDGSLHQFLPSTIVSVIAIAVLLFASIAYFNKQEIER